MTDTQNLSLHAGERVFINGAVIKVDRKVSVELLTDATFLLEQHILQPEDTTTPLRQLYFVVQTMALNPGNLDASRQLFEISQPYLLLAFSNEKILSELRRVKLLVDDNRFFEALGAIRGLFPIEDSILGRGYAAGTEMREAV